MNNIIHIFADISLKLVMASNAGCYEISDES
jgi:hypothetical protein